MRALRSRRARPGARDGERGQGLVEFAMLVPVFLLILVSLLEFGFLFDHTMTLSYGTREGARAGSAFAAGNTTTMICNPADGGLEVDKNIIASVERVLQAPGSQVDVSRVGEIRIFKANASGQQIGSLANVWTYTPGAGPVVDGQALDFSRTSYGWNACTRVNFWAGGVAPDSLGVSIVYSYRLATPLAALLGFFGPPGGPSMPISDRTIMALNPLD